MKNKSLVSISDFTKEEQLRILDLAESFEKQPRQKILDGYVVATLFFEENDVPTTMLHWPDGEEEPNVLTYLKKKKIDLVINIPKNLSKKELDNDYTIRRLAVDLNIPLITNARLASAFITAFNKYKLPDLMIKSWDEY